MSTSSRNPEQTLISLRPHQHLVSYTIGKGAAIVNVVAVFSDPANEGKPFMGPWVVDCSSDDIRKEFQDFEPEAQQLLQVRLG